MKEPALAPAFFIRNQLKLWELVASKNLFAYLSWHSKYMKMDNAYNRRVFLTRLGAGIAGIGLAGNFGFIFSEALPGDRKFRAIRIDFSKCAGCRTCEMVCSAANHRVEIGGRMMDGIGNPAESNIRVWHYNPDVDVPVTCYLCKDAPCIGACPVSKDPDTGRKAIYRDTELGIMINDPVRCIGCMSCAEACQERGAVIVPAPETNSPTRMCTLCGGDPSCVKHCPYDAITYEILDFKDGYSGRHPDVIAMKLVKELYPEWN